MEIGGKKQQQQQQNYSLNPLYILLFFFIKLAKNSGSIRILSMSKGQI